MITWKPLTSRPALYLYAAIAVGLLIWAVLAWHSGKVDAVFKAGYDKAVAEQEQAKAEQREKDRIAADTAITEYLKNVEDDQPAIALTVKRVRESCSLLRSADSASPANAAIIRAEVNQTLEDAAQDIAYCVQNCTRETPCVHS